MMMVFDCSQGSPTRRGSAPTKRATNRAAGGPGGGDGGERVGGRPRPPRGAGGLGGWAGAEAAARLEVLVFHRPQGPPTGGGGRPQKRAPHRGGGAPTLNSPRHSRSKATIG